MYGSLTFLPPSNFAVLMSNISFNTACKELKIAQIARLNQLFQLLHLAHIYGHGFYLVSRTCMLLSKNVNNDVSKDLPILYCPSLLSMAFTQHFLLNFSGSPSAHWSQSCSQDSQQAED